MGKRKLEEIQFVDGIWTRTKDNSKVQLKILTGPIATIERERKHFDLIGGYPRIRRIAEEQGVWKIANAYSRDHFGNAMAIQFYEILNLGEK